MNIRQKIKSINKKICAIFLAMKKEDIPLSAKIMAWLTVGYALSPLDLIPDFIPILGYLDDFILLPLLITLTVKLIPREVMLECEIKSENMWANGKPKKWYYAIPIIIIWVNLTGFIFYRLIPLFYNIVL